MANFDKKQPAWTLENQDWWVQYCKQMKEEHKDGWHPGPDPGQGKIISAQDVEAFLNGEAVIPVAKAAEAAPAKTPAYNAYSSQIIAPAASAYYPPAGSYSAGSYATGSYASGSYSYGSYAAGSYAAGSYASGSYSYGSYAAGSYAYGSYNAGSFNYGSYAAGSYSFGSYAAGSYAAAAGSAAPAAATPAVEPAVKDGWERYPSCSHADSENSAPGYGLGLL